MILRHVASAVATILLVCYAGGISAQQPIGILLAAGDVAKCTSDTDEKTAEVLLEHVKDAQAKNIPVHVLALGDLAYDKGSTDDFKCFDASWGRLFDPAQSVRNAESVMLPVPGNHDTQTSSGAPYYEYFSSKNNPWVFQQDPSKTKKLGYYALNFPDPTNGPWRLIGLNSELGEKGRADQNAWLRQDLADNKARCVLAFWHRPLFSSGMHGHGDCKKGEPCKEFSAPLCRPNEDAKYCKSMKRMKEAYKTLHEQGASVVLTGHDHHYEQFKRLDVDAKETPSGIRSFIVGTGGSALYRTKRKFRWTQEHEVYNHDSFGVLRIELFPEEYRWSFLPAQGSPAISLVVNGVNADNDKCIVRP